MIILKKEIEEKGKSKNEKSENAVRPVEALPYFFAGLERDGLLGSIFRLAVLGKSEMIPYVVIVRIFSKSTQPG